MKKRKLLGWAFVALTSITSCSDNTEEALTQRNEIKLTCEITPSRVTSLDYQSTQIIPGQQVGVTIAGAKSEHKNVAWNVGEEGELSNTGESVYWNNEELTITAYHPHNSEWIGTNHEFSVSTNQSDEENYRNSDLLWTTTTASIMDMPVSLAFRHKLAKINIKLVPEKEGTDLNNATISICNTKISATFNPMTGELSDAIGEPQEIEASVTADNIYTASAIVIPQEVPSGQFIKISHDDNIYHYSLNSKKKLEPNHVYDFKLTVKEKELKLELISQNIIDWNNKNFTGKVEEEIPSYYSNGTAYVAKAGELPTILPEDEKYTITSLKIVGELNGTDIKYIREMGKPYGNYQLTSIDLSEATIVEGGEAYESSYTTTNDEIGSFMFHYLKFEEIILPQNINLIDSYSFNNSNKLTRIEIPDKVKTIEFCAFEGCTSLSTIVIGNGVTSIDMCAFHDCDALKSIIIPDNVTTMGSGVFEDCGKLENVIIGKGLTTISTSTFEKCVSLTSITIPENITSIGDNAFEECKSLTAVNIGSNTKTIGSNAFYNCDALISITIPDNVTSIGSSAFYSCNSLAEVNIGKGITQIGANTFSYCPSLNSIVIPDNVITIDKQAFFGCSSLTSAIIGQGVATIGDSAFEDCDALTSISFKGNTSIGKYAFQNCDGLIHLEIPQNVSIGTQSFKGCKSLLSATINGDISKGYSAFWECESLKEVIISNNTRIDHFAFHSCSNLSSVTLDSNLKEIGQGVFLGCIAFTTINIPKNVTKIEYSAFKNIPIKKCYSYATTPPNLAIANNSGTTISIFENMDKNVVLYVPKGSKTAYKDSRWGTYFTNIIEMEQ